MEDVDDIWADLFRQDKSVSSTETTEIKKPLEESYNRLPEEYKVDPSSSITYRKGAKGNKNVVKTNVFEWLRSTSDTFVEIYPYMVETFNDCIERKRNNESKFLIDLLRNGVSKETILGYVLKLKRNPGSSSIVLIIMHNVFDFERNKVDGLFFSFMDMNGAFVTKNYAIVIDFWVFILSSIQVNSQFFIFFSCFKIYRTLLFRNLVYLLI